MAEEFNKPSWVNHLERAADSLLTAIEIGVTTQYLLMKYGGAVAKEMSPFTGLLEHAIIGKRLCCPDESIGALVLRYAAPGAFISYDITRASYLPATAASAPNILFDTQAGLLRSYLPPDVQEQPASVLTPTRHRGAMSYQVRKSFDTRTVDQLVQEGLIVGCTQQEAYERAEASEYIDDLRRRGTANEPVWQVTPKGNSLITLVPDDNNYPVTDSARRLSLAPFLAPGLLAR